jgi:ribosomal protein S18 acetylase RimI-like enzyme
MKLVYTGKRKLIMFPDRNLFITKNMEVETQDKKEIKNYKELGFKEVKENKKKEGDY